MQVKLRAWTGSEGIRWEPEDHFHFTLQFLGDAPDDSLECIKKAGREVSAQCVPFEVAIAGIGAFPNIRHPKTIWAGVSDGVPHLAKLAEYLNEGLSECGFESERHPLTPHITLARVKTQVGEKAARRMLISQAKELKKVDKEAVFLVSNVVLIQSELKPQGSVYTVLDSFTFPKQ